MRTLLQTKMLAAEVPPHIHQLNSIERAASAPRSRGRMRALSMEVVLNRHEATCGVAAIRGSEVVANMREQHSINPLEVAVANVISLTPKQLLRHTRPDLNRAGEMILRHHVLHGQRSDDVHGLPGVVPFAMTRSARNNGIVISHPRLLRCLRDTVEVRTKSDHRLPAAPR